MTQPSRPLPSDSARSADAARSADVRTASATNTTAPSSPPGAAGAAATSEPQRLREALEAIRRIADAENNGVIYAIADDALELFSNGRSAEEASNG